MSNNKGPAIIQKAGETTETGVMRARDVRFLLKGRDVDPQVLHILERIAETSHFNTLAVAELANHLDKVVDFMKDFSDIAGNMKDMINKYKPVEEDTDGTPIN